MSEQMVKYENDFKREWRSCVGFLKKHQLADFFDLEISKIAVRGFFKLMDQQIRIPFAQWNEGSVHRGLYRFLSSAYQEEMDVLQTSQIYDSITTFLVYEAKSKRIDMDYDQLTTLMLPVKTAYLLPYGAEDPLPEWQQATSNSVREYVSRWFEAFVASPECEPLLQQADASELQLYVMLFADALYNRQRKTIKNTGMNDVAGLLQNLFPGMLFKKQDYYLIEPTLTAFFNFTKRQGYMRPDHVDRIIKGVAKGSTEMLQELKAHDWYEFPKLRYAALEQQYQNGGDSQWVREIFRQLDEVNH
ncbi:hypothetical protein IWT140_01460 [Secundilactobacillus pentosiphilus]|uniref:Uncharacterized protein n=1 Tax=Secundilactobacillus pentosiphilus TaxID=1714682 RepID=A0A1Z5IPY4_9LACO|nr:hypothetical protein [Secundilactobacillus pentosiphilus]GAX03834.1 hypothetical protein IWT140_01460 [Secundilactobacillus pentosiphilus]